MICSVCGKEFERIGKTGPLPTVCSPECRGKRDYEKRDKLPKERLICAYCEKPFETNRKKQRFCSDECARRNQKRKTKATRRARKKGLGYESFDPLDVFKRDKWTCQMCGAKTPKKYRGTCDDRAPELDHIIPLALGGEHSMRNTQCLCRKCNGDKGATARGQLRIA